MLLYTRPPAPVRKDVHDMTATATHTNANVTAYAAKCIEKACEAVWAAFDGEFKNVFASAAEWAADIIDSFNASECACAYTYRVDSKLGSVLDVTININGMYDVRYV